MLHTPFLKYFINPKCKMKHLFHFTDISEDINVNIIKLHCLSCDILAKSKFTFAVTHRHQKCYRFCFIFTLA
jgi:uncharacterized protein YuzB (UPF0349 family)